MRNTKLAAFCLFAIFMASGSVEGSSHSHAQDVKERVAKDIEVLYGDDAHSRDAAVRDLIEIGNPSVAQLTMVLRNSEHRNFESAFRSVARVLGELRAAEAAPDLARLLGTGYPTLMLEYGRTNESMAANDPAFEPLIRIGDPVVPELRKQLLIAHWPRAYVILRVLKAIGTPAAQELGKSYVQRLESDLRIAKSLFSHGADSADSRR
jgi:hypothetical protein